jgi:hypothetical protein
LLGGLTAHAVAVGAPARIVAPAEGVEPASKTLA